MPNTIRVVARILAKAGHEDDVKETLSGVVAPTRQEPGCLRYELLQHVSNPAELVLLEEWQTQEALDNHALTPHIKAAEAKLADLIESSPPDVRLYQTVE